MRFVTLDFDEAECIYSPIDVNAYQFDLDERSARRVKASYQVQFMAHENGGSTMRVRRSRSFVALTSLAVVAAVGLSSAQPALAATDSSANTNNSGVWAPSPTESGGTSRPKPLVLPQTKGVQKTAAPKATLVGTSVPPASHTLPLASYGDLAVDNADQHVFVSGGNSNPGIVVTDFSGSVASTIETTDLVTDMSFDVASGTLYASLTSAHAIVAIDGSSLEETARYSLGTMCSADLARQAGSIWFVSGCGASAYDLNALALDTGTVTTTSVPLGNNLFVGVSSIAQMPGSTSEIAIEDDWFSKTHIVDVSGATPTFVRSLDTTPINYRPTFTPDGSKLISGAGLVDTTDDTLTAMTSNNGRAAAATGTVVAYGGDAYGLPDLSINFHGGSTPIRSYQLDGSIWNRGLQFSADNQTLFAVTQPDAGSSGNLKLYVISNAATAVGTITVTTTHRVAVGKVATPTGQLSFAGGPYDGVARTLHVTRTDNTGVHVLSDVTTDSAGKFTINDSATPIGRSTYTVNYDGDSSHAATTGSGWTLREIPWDVNDDGYADLVVGAPSEDLGTHKDAGVFHVIYGHAAGVSGSGSVSISQDTAGVPGSAESGDYFGFNSETGDFNGDGYPDVAVSAPGEDTGSDVSGGGIWVFFGSANGLRTDNVQSLSIEDTIFAGHSNTFMGEPMAGADFNGDGIDDLAFSTGDVNHVLLAHGSSAGLDKGQSQDMLQPGYYGVPNVASTFGWSLSAGDINGDGLADLAIGSPYDYIDKGYSAGSVDVIYGSTAGWREVTGAQRYTPNTSGVPGSIHTFGTSDAPDSFGWNVGLGDFNGDHKADLIVGAPGTPVARASDGAKEEDAGTATVLYSSGTKLTTASSLLITEDTKGYPGSPGKRDRLGETIAIGNQNGDSKQDAAVFSPGDHNVTVLRGTVGGISAASTVGWTQNTSGIPGADETGDLWGESLRFEYFKGIGPQGLAVGAPGENNGAGSVTVIYSTTTSGLVGTGSIGLSQGHGGLDGAAEAGDLFGTFSSD
jgi:FG-GAP repeat protein